MAAIWTKSLTLNKDIAGEIEECGHTGSFIIKVECEDIEGATAIFDIASSKHGLRQVKPRVSTSGSNGEKVMIVWPKDSCPILVYERDDLAPEKDMAYTLKIF